MPSQQYRSYLSILFLSSLSACSPQFEPVALPKPEFRRLGEYALVEEISPVTAHPLEELLLPALNMFPDVEGEKVNITVSRSRYPEILYHLKVDENGKLHPASMGSSYLITKEGFFLTAYHVFKDYLKEMESGSLSSVVVWYDPVDGAAVAAQPLIFSVEDDLLLGKVDLPLSNQPPIRLLDHHHPLLNRVYTVTFNNTSFLTGELLNEVVAAGTVTKNMEFIQQAHLETDLAKLGVTISMGRMAYREPQDEELDRAAFLANGVQGNSGSPVFDLVNNQAGIINTAIWSENPSLDNMIIYTESTAVRKMLQSYLDFISQK